MSTLSLDTRGLQGVRERLGRLQHLGVDPRPALEVIGETVLEEGPNRSFRRMQNPDGTRWEPLAQSTLEGKVPGTTRTRASYGSRPLHRLGSLRRSWDHEIVQGGKAVSVGTPFEHAKYHQHYPHLAHLNKGIIPKRRALPLPGPSGRLPRHVWAGISEALDALIEGMQRG